MENAGFNNLRSLKNKVERRNCTGINQKKPSFAEKLVQHSELWCKPLQIF